MTKSIRTAGAALVAILALALSACSHAPEPPKPERGEGGGQVLVPEIVEPRPLPWDRDRLVYDPDAPDEEDRLRTERAVEVIGEHELLISVDLGDGQECDRYDAEVIENDETIEISLYIGELPDAETLCPPKKFLELWASEDTVLVETRLPIGDRRIVDGHGVAQASPPIPEELSREAREGCLALGMDAEEIGADRDACLLAYWTPERLRKDFYVHVAWREYQGLPSGCNEDGICNLDGGEGDALPGEGHPFWEEQALLDPWRTTTR